MTKRLVLSERKTKSAAALADITLEKINEGAGLGVGYISRKWGSDTVQLATINRVASIIGCSALDLVEEIQTIGDELPSASAPVPKASDVARRTQRQALTPDGAEATPQQLAAEAERRRTLLAQAAGRSERSNNL